MRGPTKLIALTDEWESDGSTTSGSTTEENVVGSGLVSGARALPANFLRVGMVIKVHISGTYNTGGVAPDGCELRVYWNQGSPVELSLMRAVGITVNPVVHLFSWDLNLTVLSLGASGLIQPSGYTSLATGSGTNPSAQKTIDTTVAAGLKFTTKWTATSGTYSQFLTNNVNILKVKNLIVQVIP